MTLLLPKSVLSSGSLHRSGTSAGFRCPNQRSRHALPVRPGSAHDTADLNLARGHPPGSHEDMCAFFFVHFLKK